MSATPTVASKLPRLALRMLHRGETRTARRREEMVCARVGIELDALDDDEGRLPLPLYYALIEELTTHVAEPLPGLRLGEVVDDSDYGVLGFLFTTSPTVGVAFERMMRYQRLISDEHFALLTSGPTTRLRYRPWGPPRPAHEFTADLAAVDLVIGLQRACGAQCALTAVHLRRDRPESVEMYRQFLGCEPEFSAADNDIVFPTRLLSLPNAGANPALAAFFEDQVRRLHEKLPATDDAPTAVDQARDLIVALLPGGTPKLAAIARPLGMSTRTLQRRLRAQNTSLNELVDTVRRDLAQRHLRRGVSTGEIAMLLGFSEVSAFHRAFKRWTGVTPRRFVRAQST